VAAEVLEVEVEGLLEAVVVSAIEGEGVAVVGEDEAEALVLEEEEVEDGEPTLILHGQADSGVEAVNTEAGLTGTSVGVVVFYMCQRTKVYGITLC